MNHLGIINYDEYSGAFTWSKSRRGCSAGKSAGHVNREGYLVIKLNRKAVLAHRLAWFLMCGEWPKDGIDHINGDRTDNRIESLRAVSHAINMQNKRAAMANNKSCALLGVTWNKQHKKWQAKVMAHKRRYHVGYFSDPQLAHEAYLAAKRLLQPGCTI